MTNLNVTVVIPNYNGLELLKKNLSSVIKSAENKENGISEIIIVDDASTDSSTAFIKKKFPQVKIIKHTVNRGFSSAVNTGVRMSKGNIVALLNSDVEVSLNFLVYVLPHFNDAKVFGVSLHEGGYSWAKGIFKEGYIVHSPAPERGSAHETFWISGGSGVFRRSMWIALGGFDEKLFKFYWEDVDLSYRAHKRGFLLLWEPRSLVFHKHESVTGVRFSKRQLTTMQETNQLVFIWKDLISGNLFRKHIRGVIARLRKHPGYARIVILALLKIKDIKHARKKEKKEGKVSDEAIFAKFTD
ncbi:hypothetical protein A3A76_03875 [Candidatus Woesebacteria bacterium RIFCSPLOWO2_01_FULL_39_23]|uniref:Glycosyltransferase 2-like domain-containing protein n=1 Tax=Candidatus Woesebacteria bacterium RIFCSPHIGHO2_01_FULL_40_22 TaxID=1802499 RepID=A0A1F7YJZ1_9BACT|nr:MAG: hypothetical protein A2141_00140 [Candidatus Woesebacteria bacterium RBG_16_40_11]OGM27592.1 MAG: hypothetical protein A2628_02275 [Candidatus Woesebacteria bacterium RIFCSPHIGHO2_01_FULL_40_22]OGM36746.1 MAG: hypothetical protein A3E41_03120 [Candidatus Woesebacteria bacterium RIFCSPHIGHO2_12_FULL_38_9]OGM62766.1 MAG: hypothetical protein A3A76_03875 [Candidatus Woesebacteria bacterium RIFCSPLOWO2_01_FULL_39_23]